MNQSGPFTSPFVVGSLYVQLVSHWSIHDIIADLVRKNIDIWTFNISNDFEIYMMPLFKRQWPPFLIIINIIMKSLEILILCLNLNLLVGTLIALTVRAQRLSSLHSIWTHLWLQKRHNAQIQFPFWIYFQFYSETIENNVHTTLETILQSEVTLEGMQGRIQQRIRFLHEFLSFLLINYITID